MEVILWIFLPGNAYSHIIKIQLLYSRSPDGLCILTNSDDNVLRVFNLPPDVQQQPSSTCQTERMVYCLSFHYRFLCANLTSRFYFRK